MEDGPEAAPEEQELLHSAELVDQQLRAIQRLMLGAFDADLARLNLTMPQLRTLRTLLRGDGLSLKELSGQLGLAHSTVSSIIDRLERQRFVERRRDPADQRVTRLFLTERVHTYVREVFPRRQFSPLLTAWQHAEADERARVLDGLATLRRLLETTTRR